MWTWQRVGALGLLGLLGPALHVWAQPTQVINGNLVVAGHTNSCQDTGAPNALACTLDRPITAYVPRACYSIQAATGNTGPASVNLNNLGAKALVKVQGGVTTPLVANDYRAGQIVQFCYDGTQMQLTSPVGNAPQASGTPSDVVASGTLALPGQVLASGTCGAAQTAPAPGALATDVALTSFQGDPTSVSGYGPSATGTVTLVPYVTANGLAVKVCNNTATSHTTGAVTLNWKILQGGVLPPGVTLKEIDGGPTYYCSNGHTYACQAGWDDPNYLPIGLWFPPLRTVADATRWLDLGLNMAMVLTDDSDLSLLATYGFTLIVQADWPGAPLGPTTVGILTWDEPWLYTQAIGAIQTTPNAVQDPRFWHGNYTWSQIYYNDVEGHLMPALLSEQVVTPNTTTRHIDTTSADVYWFAGNGNTSAYSGQLLYNLDHAMTIDEHRRAAHYGDMLERQRLWQVGHFPAPMMQFVENGGPYPENTTAASYIQPFEFHAAVWASFMHGARGLIIFNHSFAGPGQSFDNLATPYYQTPQNSQPISIYNQVKSTIAQVRALAPVINSPFALGYVTVTPAPTDFAGFDVVAKYAGQKFYVFALPRYSPTLTNQSATFTVGSGTTAVVLNEARSLPISGGQFSDTFATSNTVHIYRID